MKLSQKAEYAVRAMLDLATNGGEERSLRSADIAKRSGVPEKFLEAILVELRKAGLVRSRRGPDGGHRLTREPGRISVSEIRDAVDGPLSLAPPSKTRRGAAEAVDRTIREVWSEAEEAVRRVLNGCTLDDLRRRVEEKRGALDFTI